MLVLPVHCQLACLPAPGAMLAGTPPASPICACYPRESFSKTTDVTCASVDALCVSWGPNRWENWAIVTQPKGIWKKQLGNLESCFTALGSECLESSSLLSLHRPCGGDDAT